jgi:biotin/methionine sulfoxide reductase
VEDRRYERPARTERAGRAPVSSGDRGISDGEVVRAFNGRGACFAGVVVTDALRPGVVRLSCGAWYDPASDDHDAPCAHGNANVLTRDRGTSRLSQGPSSTTALALGECRVEAARPEEQLDQSRVRVSQQTNPSH